MRGSALLVTFQFPIADARPFASKADLRLALPDWPELKTGLNPQFVHYFGKATERFREPDEAWPDEIKFIRARRGLRFDRLETNNILLQGIKFKPKCAFRRLFCDGQSVTRMEVGISNYSRFSYDVKIEEVLTAVGSLCDIPTVVKSNNTTSPLPILKQGKNLATLFATASKNSFTDNQALGFQLVEAADPLILVELNSDKEISNFPSPMPEGLISMNSESINGAKAFFCRLETKVGMVSTWILEKGGATHGQLRSLRLCLLRLHAEREVLDLIIKKIHRGHLLNPPNEEAADRLDRYFNDRIKIVNRDTWAGMRQSEIIAAFDAAQSVIRPASRSQLISRYEGCRRQVWNKISKFQEERRAIKQFLTIKVEEGGTLKSQHIHISGSRNIVTIAEYMSNVSTTVNNNMMEYDRDPEIKYLIKQLNEAIKVVAPNADPSHIKKMGKNLEALSNEISSDEPEREWYEVSLKGLKEAAKAVGEVATPIIDIINKLSPLLLT